MRLVYTSTAGDRYLTSPNYNGVNNHYPSVETDWSERRAEAKANLPKTGKYMFTCQVCKKTFEGADKTDFHQVKFPSYAFNEHFEDMIQFSLIKDVSTHTLVLCTDCKDQTNHLSLED